MFFAVDTVKLLVTCCESPVHMLGSTAFLDQTKLIKLITRLFVPYILINWSSTIVPVNLDCSACRILFLQSIRSIQLTTWARRTQVHRFWRFYLALLTGLLLLSGLLLRHSNQLGCFLIFHLAGERLSSLTKPLLSNIINSKGFSFAELI